MIDPNWQEVIDHGDQVQIVYNIGSSPYVYQDAIWMTRSEYDSTTPQQIIIIENERYEAWLNIVNPPAPAPSPVE